MLRNRRIEVILLLLHVGLYLQVLVQAQTVLSDSQDDIDAILDAHNAYRKIHGSPKLKWSSDLAKDAAAWGKRCRWEHDYSDNNQGENLFASMRYPNNEIYPLAAKSWYDEVALYDFDNPGKANFKDIGHFTQMVWKSSVELGCARVTCTDNEFGPFNADGEWQYVVCRYSPPGNMKSLGEDEYEFFKQNVLKPGEDVVLPPPKPEPEPEPEPQPPQQCNGKTKTVKLKIYGSGTSCINGAGEAAAEAVYNIIGDEYTVCKWSISCIQKPKGVSYAIVRIAIPNGREKEVMSILDNAVKDGIFYDLWGLKRVKGKKHKVCLNKQKGC